MAIIEFRQEGSVGYILLNNPPDQSLGRQFADDLLAAVHQASESDIRALVVRSEGKDFGTGGAVAEWPGKTRNWFRTFIAEVNQAYEAIEALEIPTIAAVRGKAVGGHYELILHCDLIVIADNAEMLAVEAHTGMLQLAGGLQRLADRIGRNRALKFAYLAEPISGKVAGEIGLASHVVQDADVEHVAAKLANQLAGGPTRSFAAMRSVMKAWSAGGVPGADALMLDLSMKLFETEDAQTAFLALKEATEKGSVKAEAEVGNKIVFKGR
jgi:enoyl-CoA hydratase/carnithine racemase